MALKCLFFQSWETYYQYKFCINFLQPLLLNAIREPTRFQFNCLGKAYKTTRYISRCSDKPLRETRVIGLCTYLDLCGRNVIISNGYIVYCAQPYTNIVFEIMISTVSLITTPVKNTPRYLSTYHGTIMAHMACFLNQESTGQRYSIKTWNSLYIVSVIMPEFSKVSQPSSFVSMIKFNSSLCIYF